MKKAVIIKRAGSLNDDNSKNLPKNLFAVLDKYGKTEFQIWETIERMRKEYIIL